MFTRHSDSSVAVSNLIRSTGQDNCRQTGQVNCRLIPDDLYEQLKQAANAHHRSVNSELIHCLEKTYKPTRLSAAELAYRAGELRRRVAINQLDIDEITAAKNQGRE